MDTDVLIVGAGPTGLMLANQLGRRGIRVLLIDRSSGPAQQTRAMAVHARTLEIYAHLGLAERAIELGREGDGANLWARGKHMARIPLREMGAGLSPYPYVLMLGQDDNERIMGERLADWNLEIHWNTELVALEQQSDYVTAKLKSDSSVRTIRALYVAGCDGSRSFVRESCGIRFPGAPYEQVFFVADTKASGPMTPAELNVYLWRDGFHLFFPMRGVDRWRVIGILPKHLRSRNDVSFEELAPDIVREAGVGLSFKSCDWFSTYRIHHRCVERFRDRRAFLLGDAAHVHSPMGGQGMNTGLQDAYNLAWKLALVIGERADQRLLDTYESERMPVAHYLLKSTDRAFTMIVSEGRLAALLRTRVLARVAAFAMKRSLVRARAFRTISQIGVHYPISALSQALPDVPKGTPRAGDRFPWLQLNFAANNGREDIFQRLDDTRFNLIVIGQRAPDDVATLGNDVLAHVVPETADNAQVLQAAGMQGPTFYLVRPDGYIGLIGGRLERGAVTRYFSAVGIRESARATDVRDQHSPRSVA